MLTSQNAIIRSFGHAVIQCAYIIPPSIAKVTYECKLPVEVTCPELSRIIKTSFFAAAAIVTYRKCGWDVILVSLCVSLLKRPGLAGEFASQLVSTVNLNLGNRTERIKDSDV